jgi:multidrug resistance efflux pump
MTTFTYSLRPHIRDQLELFALSKDDSFTLHVDQSRQIEISRQLAFLLASSSSGHDIDAIQAEFESRFSLKITPEAISEFYSECRESNLFEPAPSTSSLQPMSLYSDGEHPVKDQISLQAPDQVDNSDLIQSRSLMATYFGRQTAFLGSLLNTKRKTFVVIWYLVSPVAIIAALSAIANFTNIFYIDEGAASQIAFVVVYIINLLIVQYTSLSVLAAACYAEGGTDIVQSFGFKLKLGFLPRFYLSRASIFYQLPVHKRVRVFASPLIAKAVMFSVSLFISTNLTIKGSLLSYIFLSASHAALIELVLTGCPLTPSDGYGLYVSATKQSPFLYRNSRKLFSVFLAGAPRPSHISKAEYLRYILLGFLSILFYFAVGLYVAYYFANLALNSLGEFFGAATFYIVLFVLVLLFLATLFDPRELVDSFFATGELENSLVGKQATPSHGTSKSGSIGFFAILLCLTLLLFIPVPLTVGGRVVSLPDGNTQIIAEEDGFVSEVKSHPSTNGSVSKNTLLFRLTSPSLEDSKYSAEDLVEAARQQYKQKQENLRKLINTPSEDDLQIQLKNVETAQAQYQKELEELASLKASTTFADLETKRYRQLVRDGAASQQDLDRKVLLAEEARSNLLAGKQDVQTNKHQLETEQAQLTKLRNGPLPEDIAKAKAEVSETKSLLDNETEKLQAIKRRQKRLDIYMPYDGNIATPRLQEMLFKQVKRGDQLTEIYGKNSSLLQLRIPEYDAQFLSVGSQAEIRLSAFPGKRFSGRVAKLNLVAQGDSYKSSAEYSNSKIGTVYVDLNITSKDISDLGMLPGMTGYAKVKVGYQPLVIKYTRPLQRFLQLDLWTWFP